MEEHGTYRDQRITLRFFDMGKGTFRWEAYVNGTRVERMDGRPLEIEMIRHEAMSCAEAWIDRNVPQ